MNEYETGFALIPGTHKEDTGLNDVWAIFGKTVRALEATLHIPPSKLECLQDMVGPVASDLSLSITDVAAKHTIY